MITSVSNLTGLFGPASASLTSAATQAASPQAGALDPSGQDFGQVIAKVASEAVNSLKAGEAASIAGIQGKLPAQQVVESVLAAERSLQTALAVRDKMVASFQEISRLNI